MRYLLLSVVLSSVGCKDTRTSKRAEGLLPDSPNKRCVSEEGKASHITLCYDGADLVVCTDDEGCLVIDLRKVSPIVERTSP